MANAENAAGRVRRSPADAANINKGAPRLPQHDNLAAAAERIGQFRINGATPFSVGGFNDTPRYVLEQASGLATLLESAFRDVDDNAGGPPVPGDGVDTLRKIYTAQAFAAIGTLIDFAVMLAEIDGDRP